MKELSNAYLLRQYHSLSHLHRMLENLYLDLADESLPRDYQIIQIRAFRLYRFDWLETNGYQVSEEEKEFWDEIERHYDSQDLQSL